MLIAGSKRYYRKLGAGPRRGFSQKNQRLPATQRYQQESAPAQHHAGYHQYQDGASTLLLSLRGGLALLDGLVDRNETAKRAPSCRWIPDFAVSEWQTNVCCGWVRTVIDPSSQYHTIVTVASLRSDAVQLIASRVAH